MSELKQRINNDVKSAMKAGEKTRLGTLRLITAAIKQREVDDRKDLVDDDVIAILEKMLKQRRESITQYDKAGRSDLSAIEQAEIEVIQAYMPTPLSEDEIKALINTAIEETGANSMRDMGKVIGKVKPQMAGRADMSSVSAMVKSLLNAE